MLVATSAFLNGLEEWLAAIRADDFGLAHRHAEFLSRQGDLLAIHPDFIQCMREFGIGCEPEEALTQLCKFLLCVTSVRARHMRLQNGHPGSQ